MSARGWLRLLGVVLLVALVLIFKIDLAQTAALIVRSDPLDVALAVILFIPFLAAKAWRWQIILRDLNISISFGEAVKLYALGLGAGMMTPGQVGDAVKVTYLRERGLGRALLSVLLDRLWDVLVLLLLAGSGALLFWQQLEGEWLAIGLLAVGTAALLAITASRGAQRGLLKLFTRLRRSQAGAIAFEPVQLSPVQIVRQFGLTLLATALVYIRYYLLTSALNVHLDMIPFVAAMSLATVAALLPISVSGLGTRDAALLLVAGSIGITREQALGVSALILFLSVLNGLVGFGVWLFQSNRAEVWKVSKPHGPAGSAGLEG
jgi:glycosyltransferase 2 family protein